MFQVTSLGAFLTAILLQVLNFDYTSTIEGITTITVNVATEPTHWKHADCEAMNAEGKAAHDKHSDGRTMSSDAKTHSINTLIVEL